MKFLLFDLGGVLIDNVSFSALEKLMNHKHTLSEIKDMWIHSPSVTLFESGKIDADTFAKDVVSEFHLSISPKEFLDLFAQWPTGYFTGAEELLRTLKQTHTLGCLSNSNHIHWEKGKTEWKMNDYFDYCFSSHELGCVKPDSEIFKAVLSRVPFEASQIIFFDDNKVNTDAAQQCGISSYHVKDFLDLKQTITTLGFV